MISSITYSSEKNAELNVCNDAIGEDIIMNYPPAIDPDKVGTYPAHCYSGGGYFYDEVLEYRVWVHSPQGDNYHAFATYPEALNFTKQTPGAEIPIVLVLQKEHINEPQKGIYEHIKGDRLTEWLVEWLSEKTKRNENSIKKFLKQNSK